MCPARQKEEKNKERFEWQTLKRTGLVKDPRYPSPLKGRKRIPCREGSRGSALEPGLGPTGSCLLGFSLRGPGQAQHEAETSILITRVQTKAGALALRDPPPPPQVGTEPELVAAVERLRLPRLNT